MTFNRVISDDGTIAYDADRPRDLAELTDTELRRTIIEGWSGDDVWAEVDRRHPVLQALAHAWEFAAQADRSADGAALVALGQVRASYRGRWVQAEGPFSDGVDDIITAGEVAVMCGVEPEKVADLARLGQIPLATGGSWRRGEIVSALAANWR